jgi:hypothetical protein
MIELLTQIALALVLLLVVTMPGAPVVAALGGRRALPVALYPAATFAATLTITTIGLVPTLWKGLPLETVLIALFAAFFGGLMVLRMQHPTRRAALGEMLAVSPFGVAKSLSNSLRVIAAGVSVWAFVIGGWLDDGDMLAHLGIARKLSELREPTFAGINYFIDGSLHPGYPAPPWHALTAITANVSTADVATIFWLASAVLAPISALTAAGLAQIVFRSSLAGPLAALVFIAADGMARAPLFGAIGGANSPNAISTQTLLPLCLALYLAALWHPIRAGRRGALWIMALLAVPALVAVHASYLSFLAIIVGGYLIIAVARSFRMPELMRRHITVSAALFVVAVLGLLALRPALSQLVTFKPEVAASALRTELAEYSGIIVGTPAAFHLRIDMLAWFGGIIGIGLVSALLAVRRPREPMAWLLIGGIGAVLLVSQVDPLFTAFSKIGSTHQTKRLYLAMPTELGMVLGAMFVAAACGRWRLRGKRLIPILLALVVGLAWAVLVQYWPAVVDYKAGPSIPLWPIAIIALLFIPAAVYLIFRERGPAPLSTTTSSVREAQHRRAASRTLSPESGLAVDAGISLDARLALEAASADIGEEVAAGYEARDADSSELAETAGEDEAAASAEPVIPHPSIASRRLLGVDITSPVIDVRRGAAVWAYLVIIVATIPLMPDTARAIKASAQTRPSSALHAYDLRHLQPDAIDGLRDLPPRAVVLAPPHPWALRVQAIAPVYVVGVRVTHVARTVENRPVARRIAAQKFLSPGASNADRVDVLKSENVTAIFVPEGFAYGAVRLFLESFPKVFVRVTPEASEQSVWEVRTEELGRIPIFGEGQ